MCTIISQCARANRNVSILRIFGDILTDDPYRVLPDLLQRRIEGLLRLLEGVPHEMQMIASQGALVAFMMADKVHRRLEERSRMLFQEHLLCLHHFYLIVNQQQRQSDVRHRIISPGIREYRLNELSRGYSGSRMLRRPEGQLWH